MDNQRPHSQDAGKRDEKWHVGKEIPIVVLLALLIHTGGFIWFAAMQTAKLDNLATLMANFQSSQYTISDARRDQELHIGRSTNNSRRIDELMRRVERVEGGRGPRESQQ